jgi:hypothetical protein
MLAIGAIGKEFDDVLTVELFNKTISAHKGALQEVIIQLGM